jgi:dihydrodipicolinate synthase/N-acetylneuraminate lyase
MKETTVLSGPFPVLLSPMHEDGSPDEVGYARLLDHIFQAEIPGLWVLGSASEAFSMSYDERVRVTRIIARHLNGKRYLVVGCGDPVVAQVFRFFDDTADLPINAYHLLPTDRKMDTQYTIDYYTAAADRSPLPLWLYSNPARAHQPSIEAVRVLSQHPNIAGMKVGGYDLSYMSQLALMNCPGFQVIGAGDGGNLLAWLALGIKSVTSGPAGVFPKEYARAYKLWQGGNVVEARTEILRLNAITNSYPPRRNTETCAEEKAALELMGICKRHVHPPFKACTDEQVAQIKRWLIANGFLQ